MTLNARAVARPRTRPAIALLVAVLTLIAVARPFPAAAGPGDVTEVSSRVLTPDEPAPSKVMPRGNQRFHVTWEGVPLQSPLSATWLRRAFEQSPDVNVAYAEHKDLSNTAVVANPDGPGKVLRVRIPKGTTSRGLLIPVNIKQTEPGYEEVWLQYRVRFGSGFQFIRGNNRRGGKLPGLAGGPSAGNQNKALPHGGSRDTDGRTKGMSSRHMWTAFPPEPRLNQYVYHPDRPNSPGHLQPMSHGKDPSPVVLRDNRWYTVTQRVKMNTANTRRDGVIEGWVDGRFHYGKYDYRFRTGGNWGLNVLMLHVYFGGSDSQWSHTRDEHIFIDDVNVTVVR